MKKPSFTTFSEYAVLGMLALSILWRGGKSLDSTWLVGLIAAGIALWFTTVRLLPLHKEDKEEVFSIDVPWHISACACAFVFWTVLSFVFSKTQNYGFDEVIRVASFLLVFLWMARMSAVTSKRSKMVTLLSVIVTGCTLVAIVVGTFVYINQPVSRFVGTFFDHRFTTDYWPNAWAEYVLAAWPLALIAISRGTQLSWARKLFKWNMVILGAIFASLLLSYSRGAAVALLLQLVGLLALSLFSKASRSRFSMLNVLAVSLPTMAIAAALFFGVNVVRSAFHPVQSVTEKVTFTSAEGTSSIDERSQFWQQAFRLSFDHPIIGYGPYSFRFVQPQVATSVLATSDHPHNVLLKIAMENGYPALAFFLLLLAVVIFPALRHIRFSHDGRESETDSLLLISALGVLAHNMIDYNLQFVSVSLLLWMTLGLLTHPPAHRHREQSHAYATWSRVRKLLKIEWLIATVMIVFLLTEGAALVITSFARHSEARGDAMSALRWYQSATYQLLSRDRELSRSQLAIQLRDVPTAKQSIDRYLAINALDARAWRQKGNVELLQQHHSGAYLALQQAMRLGMYTSAGILADLLQTDSAQTHALLLKQKPLFDRLFSDYARAIENNTHFIALSYAPEELKSIARSLSKLFPIDEERYQSIARRAFQNATQERKVQSARKNSL